MNSREKLVGIAYQFLSVAGDSVKFSMQGFTELLQRSIKDRQDSFSFGDAADAFCYLEKIAINLFQYPWRTEFRTLKVKMFVNPFFSF